MIDDSFINTLPEDDIEAILQVSELYSKIPQNKDNLEMYLKFYSIVKSLIEKAGIPLDSVEYTGSFVENKSRLISYLDRAFDKSRVIALNRLTMKEEEKFKSIRDDIYEYEFREDDFARLQKLINKIRDLIANSQDVNEDHKNRLLQRLESLQKELHKRVTNLDKALGFLLDVSIIVKQTGEGAKPIADLAKEISKIITQVIFVSKGIPPSELPPFLK